MEIYFPITANILTPGHIKCLEVLSKRGSVIVGVLTSKALKGYKKELVPFKDRKFILEAVTKHVKNIKVVPQDSLDPTRNLKKYGCTVIASGDGFEISEQKSAEKLGVKLLEVKLPGEKYKKYSSSKICSSQN